MAKKAKGRTLQARVTEKVAKAWDVIAMALGMNASRLLRQAIKEFLDTITAEELDDYIAIFKCEVEHYARLAELRPDNQTTATDRLKAEQRLETLRAWRKELSVAA